MPVVSRTARRVRRAQPGQRGAATITQHAIKSIRCVQTSSGDSPALWFGGGCPLPWRFLSHVAGVQSGRAQGCGDARCVAVAGEMGMVTLLTPTAVTSLGLDVLYSDSIWFSPAQAISTSLLREAIRFSLLVLVKLRFSGSWYYLHKLFDLSLFFRFEGEF